MKLIIDLPDEAYEMLTEYQVLPENIDLEYFVIHSTPLTKGHGRLIDEKEATNLIAEGKNGDKAYFGTVNKDWEVIDFLKTVSTIIEADKGETE